MNIHLLPERYGLISELGSGGTSVVYKANDLINDRVVAIKVLINDRVESRFLAEADILSRLVHPNLVTFYEVGKHEGHCYIVMEYLAGGDLLSFSEGKSLEQVLGVFIDICAGLYYLHEHGFVHRDIKPSNILFDIEGRAKLADLGLSRELSQQDRITKPGEILGTSAYLAPEQIKSMDAGPAADLYGLGLCLFEVLTGRRPFRAKTEFALMKAQIEEPPPDPRALRPDISDSLVYLIDSLLEKAPENRPTNAKVVGAMLRRCLADVTPRPGVDGPEATASEELDRLSEAERSILLAIGFLGNTASFEDLCALSTFSEDKIERVILMLAEEGFVLLGPGDVFQLSERAALIDSYLSPRIRKLFQGRLYSSRDVKKDGLTALKSPPKSIFSPSRLFVLALVFLSLLFIAIWYQSASLKIDSTPQGATAIVDGRWRGGTPLQLAGLRPGRHSVRLVLDGYLRDTREVQLFPRRQAEMDFVLKESQGRLRLLGLPKDAKISINGAFYDPEEASDLVLMAGKARIKVQLLGYLPYVRDVLVKSGEPTRLEVELSPVTGELRCTSTPDGATIVVDGVDSGFSPQNIRHISYGKHEVEFRKDGYEAVTEEVVVEREGLIDVNVSLKALGQ